MPDSRRARLYEELSRESRRYLAAYVLFNQAIADHLGLHPTDVQCLSLLTAESGPLTVKQVADMTGLTTGSATRLVDRLERGGYVLRAPDPQDRRRVLVSPVPDRIARVTAVWDDLGQTWQALLDGHTEDELEVITRHMRRAHDLSHAQMQRLRSRPKPD
ncbi:DNA-binding MarR family transcriptional regulator [Streptomyces sp. 2333.5]|uniref:MarR family winged helix-turn-helix transcriptional regulator n=1 Tax=Streptomyces TaxID=1883 RepID=UPI000899D0F0|nr:MULTISPECIES: MarR family transcriptional regulator [unclassified Streptomyces]PJJ00195.1 DNA-binding MarR family transcriptional regulator [Streptomyces sp. 2333.5]SEB79838.1 DNA-binding transcriptional regulator, MarR family [Streptomyces sp. 2314.4]SEC67027.1 DNA-binding transcriptional regulator, MarR family [Streptomyces sp. 2112.2]SOE15715.1 DNA-binding transcriptional regulator, MarR family [Streptomyces sp. 2323.1]